MPFSPGRGLILGAAALLLVAGAGCNLVAPLTNCASDSDCPANRVCNPARHFCQDDTAPVCGPGDHDQNGVPDQMDDYGPCNVPGWHLGMGCPDGRRRCSSDGSGFTCEQRTAQTMEVCGNGVDDDCNGFVDDGPSCVQNYPAVTMSMPLHIGSNDPTFGEGDDAPEHGVCLDAFQIDKYEVSVEAYLRFLNSLDPDAVRVDTPTPINDTLAPIASVVVHDARASADLPYVVLSDDGTAWSIAYSPSRGWHAVDRTAGTLRLPMAYVTWFGADAFCRWAGKHLPTEAEWWRAARGADGHNEFPWSGPDGGVPTCMQANIGSGGTGPMGQCVGAPVAVDSLPGSGNPEGVLHLYGNVNEWMWDWLDDAPDHSQNHYYQSIPTDAGTAGWCSAYPHGPLGPDGGGPITQAGSSALACQQCRFARGRNYASSDVKPGIRRWLDPDRGEATTGFRCSNGGAPR